MAFDDGARRIFLNPVGEKGNQENLRNIIRYMVYSKESNAVDNETKNLHHMVETIKQKPKVRSNYMKVIEKEIKDIAKGKEQGREEQKEQDVKNLLDILDDETLSQKLGIPLERVKELRTENTIK